METIVNMEDWRKDTFVKFEDRKKILLLGDDLRMPSGVGTMSKELVLKTLHHFHWVQLGGAVTHPDMGKIIDMSPEIEKLLGFLSLIHI